MPNISLASLERPPILAPSIRQFERPTQPNVNPAYHSESASAYANLPPIIQKALLQQKRLIFIANNPSIKLSTLEGLLQPTDILVLLNHFIHADFFITNPLARTLPKLLFFAKLETVLYILGCRRVAIMWLSLIKCISMRHLGYYLVIFVISFRSLMTI